MCLSTVYRNQRVPESIVMKNVMRMEVRGEKLIFTDLMERKLEVDGNLDSCDGKMPTDCSACGLQKICGELQNMLNQIGDP